MYFCFWKVFSRPLRWASENTARRSIPRRGFPRIELRKDRALGIGSIVPVGKMDMFIFCPQLADLKWRYSAHSCLDVLVHNHLYLELQTWWNISSCLGKCKYQSRSKYEFRAEILQIFLSSERINITNKDVFMSLHVGEWSSWIPLGPDLTFGLWAEQNCPGAFRKQYFQMHFLR